VGLTELARRIRLQLCTEESSSLQVWSIQCAWQRGEQKVAWSSPTPHGAASPWRKGGVRAYPAKRSASPLSCRLTLHLPSVITTTSTLPVLPFFCGPRPSPPLSEH
jgi:hypothetical protein